MGPFLAPGLPYHRLGMSWPPYTAEACPQPREIPGVLGGGGNPSPNPLGYGVPGVALGAGGFKLLVAPVGDSYFQELVSQGEWRGSENWAKHSPH